MKIVYFFMLFLLSSLCFAFDDDYDGDGLVGEKDKYPILAELPEVTWEIKKLIFTWDVETEWLLQNKDKSKKNHLIQTKFSFGAQGNAKLSLDGAAIATFNPFKLFGNYARFQAGVHVAGYVDWGRKDHEEMEKCLEALSYQKTHIKNPHWEITVWIKNRTRRTLIAEDLEVPLLDQQGNVITYARPHIFNGKSKLTIPARRNVPIKFRAEIKTTEAFEKISFVQKNLPVFSLPNSMGILNWKKPKDDEELDIISKIQLMREKTAPFIFEHKGYQVSWRVAKFKNGRPVTIQQALEEIHNKILGYSQKPLYVMKNTELVELAGYKNTDENRWEISVDGSRVNALQSFIGEKVVIRYGKTGNIQIKVENPITKLLQSIANTYIAGKNNESLDEATKAY